MHYKLGENVFEVEELKIPFIKFGKGKKAMLAFHGFNKNIYDFTIFEPSLGDKFTVYSFGLLYHHKYHAVDEETIFTVAILKKFINSFLTTIDKDRFSLLGFSLGGRLCLKIIEVFAPLIEKAFLLAPEGIRINPWYRLITQQWPEDIFQEKELIIQSF